MSHKSELEVVQKNVSLLEKSSNIIHNPEVIQKLKSKITAFPEKMEKMKNKWSLYENEQKSILMKIKDEIAKKKVCLTGNCCNFFIFIRIA